ncbi:MAG TPA: tetratricopeptide repeat protein [Pseudonocardiaceae bacterium]
MQTGDLMAQAHALNNMSQVERELGRPAEAIAHVRAAVALFDEIGDVGYQRLAGNNLIELCLEQDHLDEAEVLARQALNAIGAGRPDLQHAFTRELYGRVLLARANPTALDELRAALVWAQRLDSPRAPHLADLIATMDAGPSRSALFV